MDIRIGRDTDKPSLKKLAREVILHNYTPFLGAGIANGFIDRGQSDEVIDLGIQKSFVAVEGEEIVGFAIVGDNHLELLMVDIAHQKKGYGTTLLSFVEEKMQEGFTIITLQTFETNEQANEFYYKNGWVESGKNFVDDLQMHILVLEKSSKPSSL